MYLCIPFAREQRKKVKNLRRFKINRVIPKRLQNGVVMEELPGEKFIDTEGEVNCELKRSVTFF